MHCFFFLSDNVICFVYASGSFEKRSLLFSKITNAYTELGSKQQRQRIHQGVMTSSNFIIGTILLTCLPVLYIRINDRRLGAIPQKALTLSPKRWTDEEIQETYERCQEQPVRVNLPTRTGRRYIVGMCPLPIVI